MGRKQNYRNREFKISSDDREGYQGWLKNIPGAEDYINEKIDSALEAREKHLGRSYSPLHTARFDDILAGANPDALYSNVARDRGPQMYRVRKKEGGWTTSHINPLSIGNPEGPAYDIMSMLEGYDPDWQDDYAQDHAYLTPQQQNQITRDEGLSDVAPWQFIEDKEWGGTKAVPNPYSAANQAFYEQHGGREQAIRDLGQDNPYAINQIAQLGQGQEKQDYWAWSPPSGWHEQNNWQLGAEAQAVTESLTQAAQGGGTPAPVEAAAARTLAATGLAGGPDEDQA